MIFFDFEVFKYDWLLVTFNGKEFTRIENDCGLVTTVKAMTNIL